MLIMRYNGGLGNQMFQFAAAASLAHGLGVDFAFDMDFFNRGYSRPYGLDVFNIEKKEAKGFKYKALWALRKHIKNSFFGLNVYGEKDFNYEKRFEEITDNTYIYGFFQSHKYINPEVVKKYFTFKAAPDEKNARLIKDMKARDSVSLHIRRGDYVQKKRYAGVYNHLDLNHYSRALEIVAKKLETPVVYVFSDDINWARENLTFKNCPLCLKKGARFEFVSHNTGEKSYEDLRLMSNCKHNIIANSSFSWWGAYLNENPQKIVAAPKKWFQKIKNKPYDLYPQNWVII